MPAKRARAKAKPTTPPPEQAQTEPVRPRLFLRWRFWLPRAVFESLLIVFSVILALSLQRWIEVRADERRLEQARRFFAEEILENRRLLLDDFYLPHHRVLQEKVRTADSPEAFRRAVFEEGVHAVRFQDAVWRSFSTNDELVRRFEPEELFLLAEIYRRQAEIDEINDATFAIILNDFLDPQTPVLGQALVVQAYLSEVVNGENRLVELYDAALKTLPD